MSDPRFDDPQFDPWCDDGWVERHYQAAAIVDGYNGEREFDYCGHAHETSDKAYACGVARGHQFVVNSFENNHRDVCETVTITALMADGTRIGETVSDFGDFASLVLAFKHDSECVRVVWHIVPATVPAVVEVVA